MSSNNSIHSRYLFVMTCTVTFQPQLCGTLTIISHYLAVRKSNSFVIKQSDSNLHIVSKCYNFHLILIAGRSYSKF